MLYTIATMTLFSVWGGISLRDFWIVLKVVFTMKMDHCEEEEYVKIACSAVFMFLFVLLVSLLYLFSLNVYLMLTNKTTWELFSKYKISYLEEFRDQSESPFSRGQEQNLKNYWAPGKHSYIVWKGRRKIQVPV